MDTRRNPPTHWIKPNETSRIPRVHIVLDCEATIERKGLEEFHKFRCAVTSKDEMKQNSHQWKETEWGEHESDRAVWEWITDRCPKRKRTVVVAHNAGYDLRVTNGLANLDRLGWSLRTLSLSPGSTWGTWRKEDRTLVLVDSMTWLPTALWRLGLLVGRPKEKLPEQDDSPALWWNRCRTDVEILRECWLRVIRWLRSEDAGNWRPTGAGTSWSYWRHKHYTHPILVHDNQEVRELERKAAWTGRAEAWRTGKLENGPWIEWDMTAAYARIARDCNVPVKLIGETTVRDWQQYEKLCRRYHILAECFVETEVPTIPTYGDAGIIWPIGKFDTVLWQNEVQLCRENSGKITLGRCFLYAKKPALQQWANWVLGSIDGASGESDPVIQSMHKHWSRALIGRFGSSYATWEEFAKWPDPTTAMQTVRFAGEDSNRRMLTVGTDVFLEGGRQDAWDSCPSIMSFVMAEARCRLWQIIVAAGIESVVYMDTDSVIVDSAGSQRLDSANIDGLRVKGRWEQVEIIATRRVITDGELRASGIPKGAIRRGDGLWSAEVWQQMAGSLREGVSDVVKVTRKTMRIGETDNRRIRTESGATLPIRIG